MPSSYPSRLSSRDRKARASSSSIAKTRSTSPRCTGVDTYRGLRVLESGLEAGQRVIVEGIQLVRQGQTVDVDSQCRSRSS